jgi:hypothetical protein
MKSKYHNKKITRDGETFDSIKEYRRFCELSLLAKAGKVTDLKRQVKFVLIPAQYDFVPLPYSRQRTQELEPALGQGQHPVYLPDTQRMYIPALRETASPCHNV